MAEYKIYVSPEEIQGVIKEIGKCKEAIKKESEILSAQVDKLLLTWHGRSGSSFFNASAVLKTEQNNIVKEIGACQISLNQEVNKQIQSDKEIGKAISRFQKK